jgi:Bacterial Ig-like domain (group 3)/OmpA-like transmembrane domain/Passenger-associated-transport-repeat
MNNSHSPSIFHLLKTRRIALRQAASQFVAAMLFAMLPAIASATIFTVTSNADSGVGSLRQAIDDSNADFGATSGSPHQIIFASPGTISLASPLQGINNHVNVNTTAPVALTVDGGGANGIFSVGASLTVTLANLTVANGGAAGLTVGSGASVTLDTVTFTGDLTLGGGGTVIGSNALTFSPAGGITQTVSRAISGASYSLVKNGAGTLVLNGANTIPSGTTITAGTLMLGNSGALGGGAVVNNGGVIDFVSPLTVAAGSFSQAGGTLTVVASGIGCVNDRLNVAGSVALAGTLNFSLANSCAPNLFQPFTIIANNGSTAVSGTFSGLAEGAVTSVGGFQFTVSYKGGGGKDVTFTRTGPLNTQTIIFPNVADKNVGDSAQLSATGGGSTNPVTFTASPPNVCNLSGSTANFIGVGTCTLTANQAGNSTYSPAPPVAQDVVVSGIPGVTLTPAASLSFADQQVNTTSAKQDVKVTNSGTASLTITAIAVTGDYAQANTCGAAIAPGGSCTISISFTPTIAGPRPGGLGFSSNAPNTPHKVSLTGNGVLGTQTITFGALANKIFGNPAFTVSALGGLSGNTVTFTSLTTAVCTVTTTGTVTIVTAGTCTIAANQAGNSFYSAAAEVRQSFTVDKANQTIPFSTLTNPPQVFSSAPFVLPTVITLSTVTNSATGLAATFTSTTPLVCSVSGNSVTMLTAGTCTIQADQAGNGNYNAATAVKQSFTTTKAAQTITFGTLPAKTTYLDPPFSISGGAASSGLPVAYSVITTPTSPTLGVCNVTPTGSVTILTAGICSIAADQAGDGGYSPAPRVIQDLSIAKAKQTIGFAALAARAYNPTAFDITATRGSSNNPVTFSSTTPAICTVPAGAPASTSTDTAKVTMVTVGSCTIKADEAFSTNFAAATLSTSFVISPATQAIAFGALSNKIFGDVPFALPAATGGASSNPVTFTASPATVCTVSGNTVTIAGAGDCTIAADQAGNNNYSAALQVPQKFTVAKASQLINFVVANQDFTSAPIPISATGGKSGNPVVFTSTTPSICTVSSTASVTTVSLLTIGTCKIQATQDGNANYLAASSDASFVLGTASQSITFADIPSKSFDDLPFALVASGGASGNPVTFTSTPVTVCTVSGNTVTIVGTGPSCTITANQAGDGIKYTSAAPVSKNFTVASAKQVIIFNALASKTFGDAPFDISATGGASGNAVTFASTTPAVCTVSGNKVSIAGAGTCSIEASQTGNANYAAATTAPQSFDVAKAAQSITFADNLPARILGDAPFNLSATASTGLPVSFSSLTGATCEVAQNVVTVTATGTCTIRASQQGDGNYEKAADVDRSFNVSSNSAISFSPLPVQPKTGEPITLTVTVKPQGAGATPTGTVIFSDNGTAIGTVPLVNGVATFTINTLANGNHKITATYSGDANNNKGTSDVFGVTVLVQTTVTGGGGSGAGSGGGGGCTLNPQGEFDPAMPVLLFAAAVFFIRRNKMNLIRFLPVVLLSTVLGGNVFAAEPGFYVGLGGGKSSSEGDNYDFNQRLKGAGFNDVNTTLKFQDFAWKVFGGYQINQYLAAEAAYLDLGKVTVTANGAVADPAAFANAVARVQPRLAKGGSLSVVGSIPVNPKFFAYAKLGYMHWSADAGASTGSLITQTNSSSGNAALFALGGEAELTSGWSARGEVERYQIKPDAANLFTLNLIYRF